MHHRLLLCHWLIFTLPAFEVSAFCHQKSLSKLHYSGGLVIAQVTHTDELCRRACPWESRCVFLLSTGNVVVLLLVSTTILFRYLFPIKTFITVAYTSIKRQSIQPCERVPNSWYARANTNTKVDLCRLEYTNVT